MSDFVLFYRKTDYIKKGGVSYGSSKVVNQGTNFAFLILSVKD